MTCFSIPARYRASVTASQTTVGVIGTPAVDQTWKQISLGLHPSPILSQGLEKIEAEQDVAVPRTFTLPDTNKPSAGYRYRSPSADTTPIGGVRSHTKVISMARCMRFFADAISRAAVKTDVGAVAVANTDGSKVRFAPYSGATEDTRTVPRGTPQCPLTDRVVQI